MKGFTARRTPVFWKSFWKRLVANRWLRITTSVLLSVLSLYLALRDVSWNEVKQAIWSANWGYLSTAFACLCLHHWAKAVRWQVILSQVRPKTLVDRRFKKILLVILVGQMLNLVYPARVGDISRAVMVGNETAGKVAAGGTIILEKTLDMIFFGGMIIVLASLVTLPGWLAGSLWGMAGMSFIFLGLLYVLIFQSSWIRRIEQRLLSWIHKHSHLQILDTDKIGSALGSFHAGLAGFSRELSWSTNLTLAAWSFLVWGMSILVNFLVLLALNLPLQNNLTALSASVLVLVGLQAGTSVPAAPGRVGVFEYICILALSAYGVTNSTAFSYGVLLHILVMLPLSAAGFAALSILGLDRSAWGSEPYLGSSGLSPAKPGTEQ